MINVYLDDFRPCPQGFVLARNVEECIELLKNYDVNILSLDHDLGFGQPTGYDLVVQMVENGYYANEIYLHSSSASGRMSMYRLLQAHKPDHVVVYEHPMPAEVLKRVSTGGS
ncbi:hypothetical protein PRECH8_15680 [Insulibacter thermoxylanivorax]|uniref:Cyclic-phosphate processing Receiver domain-containing protein n=1 Tax=Insulibacter thermoxylanivorax TaxID=2749268 RepID=A0A916VFG2_9BACL|nr:cyclic-phosphate processing receiver domain-containing protein [Insulibacter thermoxylanivorax]GFR38272.1 hypothetical protein PRECH8_15680 [Insulibacter thermoxylanivorax]